MFSDKDVGKIKTNIKVFLWVFVLFFVSVLVISLGFVFYAWFKDHFLHGTDITTSSGTMATKEDVDKQIWEWIRNIGFVIGAVAAVLGYFGFKSFDSMVERKVQEKADEVLKNTIVSFQASRLRLEIMENKSAWEHSAQRQEAYLYRAIALLEKAEKLEDKVLISELGERVIFFYNSLRKFDEIFNLQKKYKDIIFDLDYKTWITVAAADAVLYAANTEIETYKRAAILAANNSMSKLSEYGAAHGIILFINMIDYHLSINEAKRNEVKAKAKFRMNTLLSNETTSYTRIEANDYISDTANGNYILTPYAKLLYELFPEDMKKLGESKNNKPNS